MDFTKKLNILVVGGGGREHAIIRTLKKSPFCGIIYAMPGNAGMKDDAVVTGLPAIPPFLRKDVADDGRLRVYANGEIDYALRGVHAKVRVLWNFEAPAGGGDTHYSLMRGTRANLVIRQGAAQRWQPVLYVEPAAGAGADALAAALGAAMAALQETFPGVGAARRGDAWEVLVPPVYHVGHEAHFGQVAAEFLRCVAAGALPAWEVPGMLAKYWTTTRALALARG